MINANIRLPPSMLIGQRGGNVARGQEVRGKRYKGRRVQRFASGFVMIYQTGGFGISVNNQIKSNCA